MKEEGIALGYPWVVGSGSHKSAVNIVGYNYHRTTLKFTLKSAHDIGEQLFNLEVLKPFSAHHEGDQNYRYNLMVVLTNSMGSAADLEPVQCPCAELL